MSLTKEDSVKLFREKGMPPQSAQKKIHAGRLKGMTDIKPQWRIEALTELYGLCGFGWYYKVTDMSMLEGSEDQFVCIVDIELYIRVDEDWSMPIVGSGGSMFRAKEKNGIHTSDEAIKMATTDALSVACKQIGIGGDIYMGRSESKYQSGTHTATQSDSKPQKSTGRPLMTKKQFDAAVKAYNDGDETKKKEVRERVNSKYTLTPEQTKAFYNQANK